VLREYEADIHRRDLLIDTYAVERKEGKEEGLAEGEAKGKAEGIAEGKALIAFKVIETKKMTRDEAIATFSLGEVEINLIDQMIAAEGEQKG